MSIIVDYGYVLDEDHINSIREEVQKIFDTVCPDSETAWESVERRELVFSHLMVDHGLMMHPQMGEIATLLELDSIIRQIRKREVPSDVIYQRRDYQPD